MIQEISFSCSAKDTITTRKHDGSTNEFSHDTTHTPNVHCKETSTVLARQPLNQWITKVLWDFHTFVYDINVFKWFPHLLQI